MTVTAAALANFAVASPRLSTGSTQRTKLWYRRGSSRAVHRNEEILLSDPLYVRICLDWPLLFRLLAPYGIVGAMHSNWSIHLGGLEHDGIVFPDADCHPHDVSHPACFSPAGTSPIDPLRLQCGICSRPQRFSLWRLYRHHRSIRLWFYVGCIRGPAPLHHLLLPRRLVQSQQARVYRQLFIEETLLRQEEPQHEESGKSEEGLCMIFSVR